MADIQFKGAGGSGNAAYDQFSKMEQDRRANTYADIAVENADINRQRAGRENTQFQQAQQVDRAIGSSLENQQTGRSASMVRSLAKTPGGGQAALRLQQQDQQESDQWERNALTAAAAGDEQTYQHFKKKAGLVVPPEVDADVKARAVYARGALVAERLYRNDHQRAYRFVQEYMRDGDMARALGTTGAPVDKPHWSVTQLEMEGKRVLGMVDTISGRVMIPKGADGKPYQSSTGYRGAGATSGTAALVDRLVASGLSTGEAFQAVNDLQRGVSPQRAYIDTVNKMMPKLQALYGPEQARRMADEAGQAAADIARQSPLYRIGKTGQPDAQAAGPAAGQPSPYQPSDGPPPPRPTLTPPGSTGQPQGFAVPPELSSEPDGTVVADDAGRHYEKRGNVLIPLGQ